MIALRKAGKMEKKRKLNDTNDTSPEFLEI